MDDETWDDEYEPAPFVAVTVSRNGAEHTVKIKGDVRRPLDHRAAIETATNAVLGIQF